MPAWNPSTLEAKAGCFLQVQGQLDLEFQAREDDIRSYFIFLRQGPWLAWKSLGWSWLVLNLKNLPCLCLWSARVLWLMTCAIHTWPSFFFFLDFYFFN